MDNKQVESDYAVCVKNDGYQVSLETRKIYRIIPDRDALSHKMIRVIDESGEEYLFPAGYFIPIQLPDNLIETLAFVA
jgi:hypothetical protein